MKRARIKPAEQENRMLKRAGLAVIAIAGALAACAPRPDALPPVPTETFYRLMGKEELVNANQTYLKFSVESYITKSEES